MSTRPAPGGHFSFSLPLHTTHPQKPHISWTTIPKHHHPSTKTPHSMDNHPQTPPPIHENPAFHGQPTPNTPTYPQKPRISWTTNHKHHHLSTKIPHFMDNHPQTSPPIHENPTFHGQPTPKTTTHPQKHRISWTTIPKHHHLSTKTPHVMDNQHQTPPPIHENPTFHGQP